MIRKKKLLAMLTAQQEQIDQLRAATFRHAGPFGTYFGLVPAGSIRPRVNCLRKDCPWAGAAHAPHPWDFAESVT